MPSAHIPTAVTRARHSRARTPRHFPGASAALRTIVARDRLDRALARGESPRRRADLELRARQLLGGRNRRALAAGLEEAVAIARGARRPRLIGPPLARAEIRAAAPTLLVLARELRTGRSPDPAGVARTRLLTTDGLGPLYVTGRSGALAHEAEEILEALRGERASSR